MSDTFFTTSGSSPGETRKVPPASPDVLITSDGSVVLFQLLTNEAQAFVDEFVSTESWQWLGSASFAVDHRFASDLAGGMVEHGLAVRL